MEQRPSAAFNLLPPRVAGEKKGSTGAVAGRWTRVENEEPIGTPVASEQDHRAFWLQSSRGFFGDVRIPRSPPPRAWASLTDWSALDEECIAYWCKYKAFAGLTTTCAADARFAGASTITWERHIDFQPNTGAADVGIVSFADAARSTMVEYGVPGDDYKEVWRRDADARADDVLAVTLDSLPAVARKGILVGVGEWCILADDRRPPLPRFASLSNSLRDQMAEGLNEREARRWFNCEVSIAQYVQGSGFVVRESTLPWRVGQPLLTARWTASRDHRATVVEMDDSELAEDWLWKVAVCTYRDADACPLPSALHVQ